MDQKEFQKAEVPAGTPRLRAVTYAVRHFVAVGDAGTVLLSPNGVDWAPQKSDVDVTLRGITYGRQKFVAVGDDGVIISSADGGKTWAKTTSGTTANLNAIAFVSSVRSNVRFFTAVGAGGTVLTSRNGKEWFKQPIEGTDTFVAVVAKGNAYVASDKGVVYASDEDASFSRRESGIGLAPIGMVSGNGLFMAADASGNVAVSRDFTKSWDRAMAARGKAEGILYADDKFVLMGPGLLASSADGNAWTPMPQPEGSPSFAAATSYTLGPPSDEEPQDSSVLKKHDQPKWVQNLPAPIRNNIGYVFTGLGIAAVFITIMMFREGKAKPKSTRKLAPGERANLPPLPIDSPILRVFENTNPMRVKINTGPFLPFEFRDPWLVVDEMNLDLTDAEPVYKHERTRFLLNNRSVIEFKEVEFDGKRSMWDT
ncbi:hypothetical protein DB346_15370 [Verrucomicrobia bacterium LW23]|nr:hypothetical protein DB346_15370 [Verrucomicrobia bacterium LW23]